MTGQWPYRDQREKENKVLGLLLHVLYTAAVALLFALYNFKMHMKADVGELFL